MPTALDKVFVDRVLPENTTALRASMSEISDHGARATQSVTGIPNLSHRLADQPISGGDTITAANGRTFRKGDLVIDLHFGDYAVGDVRFVGLPRWTSSKIVHLKEPSARSLRIHFKQKYTMNADAFADFSRNVSRQYAVTCSID